MHDGLEKILNNPILINTRSAKAFINKDKNFIETQEVEAYYKQYAETYIPLGDLSDIFDRISSLLKKGKKSFIGSFVADPAHGKTSSLIFLWKKLEAEELMCIPPFQLTSFSDILTATYEWTRYKLSKRYPVKVEDLNNIYRKYSNLDLDSLAVEYNLDVITAKRLLEDGKLLIDISPHKLFNFILEIEAFCKKLGYNGLVILADEIQQFFLSERMTRVEQGKKIQQFREFVWDISDLDGKNVGIIFGTTRNIESLFKNHTPEIIDRIGPSNNLYINLGDIYDVQFPKLLWERYIAKFKLGDFSKRVIDDYTLEALGQISTRTDLSHGPRTVIDTLKIAVKNFDDTGDSYSPIDLGKDIESSTIAFQKPDFKRGILEALRYPLINDDRKKSFIYLLGAFPRGCRYEVVEHYGFGDLLRNEFSKPPVHGNLVTNKGNGIYLLAYDESGPELYVDTMLRNFATNYLENDASNDAIEVLNADIIPRLFNIKNQGTSIVGWKRFDLDIYSRKYGYEMKITGSFDARYPFREVIINIVDRNSEDINEIDHCHLNYSDFHFCFNFILNSKGVEGGYLELIDDYILNIFIDLRYNPDPNSYPTELKRLQDYIGPTIVSPLSLLSLINYINYQEKLSLIPESDKLDIEFLKDNLLAYVIQWMFNEKLSGTYYNGQFGVSNVFFENMFRHLCELRYSDYHTLIYGIQMENMINDYIHSFDYMSLKQIRGKEPISEKSKEAVAKFFNLTRVTSFEDRLNSTYKNLIKKEKWDTHNPSISLVAHPLETTFLNALENSSQFFDNKRSLFIEDCSKLAKEKGYLDKEFSAIIDLLISRRYILLCDEDKEGFPKRIIENANGPNPNQVIEECETIKQRIGELSQFIDSKTIEPIQRKIENIYKDCNENFNDLTDETLDHFNIQLIRIEREFKNLIESKLQEKTGSLLDKKITLSKTTSDLRNNILKNQIVGTAGFVEHINEKRIDLQKEEKNIINEINGKISVIQNSIGEETTDRLEKIVKIESQLQEFNIYLLELSKKLTEFKKNVDYLKEWKTVLESYDHLYNELNNPLAKGLLDELKDINRDIREAFTTDPKILSNHEVFSNKIRVIRESWDMKVRDQISLFNERRASLYEQRLRQIGVTESLLSGYDLVEGMELSLTKLYSEVESKVQGILNELKNEIENARSSLLRVEFLLGKQSRDLVDQQKTELKQIIYELSEINKNLLVSDSISDEIKFLSIVQNIENLSKKIQEQKVEWDREYHPQDVKLNDIENAIIESLSNTSQLDFMLLFEKLRKNYNDLEIEDLSGSVNNLFKYDRIKINVCRRN